MDQHDIVEHALVLVLARCPGHYQAEGVDAGQVQQGLLPRVIHQRSVEVVNPPHVVGDAEEAQLRRRLARLRWITSDQVEFIRGCPE